MIKRNFSFVALSLSALLLSSSVHAQIWFRPNRDHQWQTVENWISEKGVPLQRIPNGKDVISLNSSRLSGATPLLVTDAQFPATFHTLRLGERTSGTQVPAITVAQGSSLLCAGSDGKESITIGGGKGTAGKGILLLKGGTLTFSNPSARHRNLVVRSGTDSQGELHGWGLVKSAKTPNVRMLNNGLVIADGEGTARTLDLHQVVSTKNTIPVRASDKNGWHAIRKGKLLYPRTWIDGSRGAAQARCLGDVAGKLYPEMVNSIRARFAGLPSGQSFFRGALYAHDHPAVGELPAGRCIGVWGLGLYKTNDGWDAKDTQLFKSSALKFRYDTTALQPGDLLLLFRKEGGKWVRVGVARPDPERGLISTTGALSPMEPEGENIGRFALIARKDDGSIEIPAPPIEESIVIDKKLPAGNILVEGIEEDTVFLQNELRDTKGWWFYWAFRTLKANGKTLTFTFTNGQPVCTRGPCISLDKGKTWTYSADSFTPGSFVYTFPEDADEVWFSMGMNYTQRDWEKFISSHADQKDWFELSTLCRSRKGRPVERGRFGALGGDPKYRIFVTCRHHSAEMMASYVVEGILDGILANNELGDWFRKNVELRLVPFVDKDGVEDGDQGKNRKPHDHNRDYTEHLYPETRAIRDWIMSIPDKKVDILVDIHCPWIRGGCNETIYQAYTSDKENAEQQLRLGKLIFANQTGGMRYRLQNDIPFGTSWNTSVNYHQGLSFKYWALSEKDLKIKVTTTIEVPFASANGATVTPDTCREFGRDLVKVFRLYLTEKSEK